MFHSLNEHSIDKNIERCCLVTNNISCTSCRIIENYGIKPIKVSPIQLKTTNRWSTTFTKFHAFNMTQYNKIIWVDADMFIVNNLDNLFNYDHISCVESRAPLSNNKNKYPFNSGLMVIKPNTKDFNKICALAPSIIKRHQFEHLPIGDQNVLNEYFDSWPNEVSKHLPDGYNIFWGSIEEYINSGYSLDTIDNKTIYVIHFTGIHKPWKNISYFIFKTIFRCFRYRKHLPSKITLQLINKYKYILKKYNNYY